MLEVQRVEQERLERCGNFRTGCARSPKEAHPRREVRIVLACAALSLPETLARDQLKEGRREGIHV